MFAWDLLFSLFKCIASNENQRFASNKFNGFLFFSLKKTIFYLSFDYDLTKGVSSSSSSEDNLLHIL